MSGRKRSRGSRLARVPKVPKARRGVVLKSKRESMRDLRRRMETLQNNYDRLATKSRLWDDLLRNLAELLGPHIEEIAAIAAEDAVNDHEISDHMGKL